MARWICRGAMPRKNPKTEILFAISCSNDLTPGQSVQGFLKGLLILFP
jgi:hypothetical protein